MKKFFLILILCSPFIVAAQIQDSAYLSEMKRQIFVLEKEWKNLQSEYSVLQEELADLKNKTGNLTTQMTAADSSIANIDDRYGLRLSQTNESLSQTNKDVQNNELQLLHYVRWGIIAFVFLALIIVILYLLLRSRINKKGNDIEQLRALADELNHQIVERMDKELAELQKIAATTNTQVNTTVCNDAEPDHSLVKALAYGITRIEYNLHSISPEVKGYKQLQIALRKMKDNLRANNYEIIDMLGHEYNEGMTLNDVTFKEDLNMGVGKQIITRVIKPQINYLGKAIQYADIEVSRKDS